MLSLYNAALWPLRAALPLVALWQGRGARRGEWEERRARRLPAAPPGGVWLHGASVGEARIVAALAGELRRTLPDRPVSVSALTPQGRAMLPEPPEVAAAFFAPLDFRGRPARVLEALRPACLALVETELWPNTLSEARRAGTATLLLNGRLSPSKMDRYRRFAGLYRPLLQSMARVGAQSAGDAERFRSLGVDDAALVVTGNIKYDLPLPTGDADDLRRRIGVAAGRPVFVAGSLAPPEDGAAFAAVETARREHPELFLVLAPRHVERAADIVEEARRRRLDVRRLTEVDSGAPPARDVLVVDTLGELASLYRLASVAFVGGSLARVGGHNVLEPAAVGVPVLFGPHTWDAAEPAASLLAVGAAWRVADDAALAQRVTTLLGDAEARAAAGRAGREALERDRGALASSAALIGDVIGSRTAGSVGVR